MIIENGHIEFKHKTGGGINPETGHSINPSYSWGSPIPCQYRANTYNGRGKVNGEHFTTASWEIIINGIGYTSRQIRLSDAWGNVIGEFSAMSVDELATVDQTKILV